MVMMTITASATPVDDRSELDWECWRCGKQHKKGKPPLNRECRDCKMVESGATYTGNSRKTGRVPGLAQPCRSWLRDYDDQDNPITPEGDLVAPGRRLCGHSDCVEPTHIEVVDG